MIIIDIKRAKKHCYEVCFEDESILLDIDVVVSENLKNGIDLRDIDIETLKYKSNFTRAKSKALWLLEKRDYSKKEMFDKLKTDFGVDASEEAVELLSEGGLIDDERFARYYASDLALFKGLSKKGIKIELTKKGIESELAQEIAEQTVTNETEQILKIIEIKYKGYAEDEKIKRRMFAGLARKGYSYSEISHALRTLEDSI